jgi:hypothetical protein
MSEQKSTPAGLEEKKKKSTAEIRCPTCSKFFTFEGGEKKGMKCDPCFAKEMKSSKNGESIVLEEIDEDDEEEDAPKEQLIQIKKEEDKKGGFKLEKSEWNVYGDTLPWKKKSKMKWEC